MDARLKTLAIIYSAHKEQMTEKTLACAKGCATCCTRNVTLTTLEGRRLYDWIASEAPHLMDEIKKDAHKPRQIPTYTINGLTDLCMAGDEVPEESSDPGWGACPLLSEEGLCQVYEARPFACRSMVSQTRCEEGGFAEMDDLTLTVNNALMQYIEHTDDKGLTGNLTDVLLLLEDEANRTAHEAETLTPPDTHFMANRPAQVLMVPPPHREAVGNIMQEIQAKKG
ncbi:YkgJ family cysteine cluster protein [Desulfoluna sp.]|uniref:YkgJ family cysteine cluster protein n=1 Tax=Desulfoluna sp. TaxID=2045199 RepID=UPI002608F5AF|nr:YkgJ family cysteine cluster protein [Desulfoluna sp.]